jgi:phenylalanyl-tRNA synthetase beta chain
VEGLVPGRSARLVLAGDGSATLGVLGQVEEGNEGYPLFVAELATAPFLPLPGAKPVGLPPRVPGVAVDLTLTHSLDVPWAAISRAIEARRPAELASFELENRYQGAGVPAGSVNTTVHFVYNAADRSLTQEEVNGYHTAIAQALVAAFGSGAGEGGAAR